MSSCLDSYGFGNQWRFQVPTERRVVGCAGVGIITYIRCTTFAVGFAARSVVCGLVCVTYGVILTINLVAFGHFDDAVFES